MFSYIFPEKKLKDSEGEVHNDANSTELNKEFILQEIPCLVDKISQLEQVSYCTNQMSIRKWQYGTATCTYFYIIYKIMWQCAFALW